MNTSNTQTYFDFFGALEYRFGDFLNVVLVLVVDRLADFVFEEYLGVGGVFLDLLFQFVNFFDQFGVGVFAEDFSQFGDFGFQLCVHKRTLTIGLETMGWDKKKKKSI